MYEIFSDLQRKAIMGNAFAPNINHWIEKKGRNDMKTKMFPGRYRIAILILSWLNLRMHLKYFTLIIPNKLLQMANEHETE